MKKQLLGALAVLTIAAPATAFAQSGYVGATYTNVDTDAGDDDSWGLEGAVAMGGPGKLGFELDAAYANSDASDDAWALGGHLYGRTDTHLLGGFLTYADAGDDASAISFGVEGEKYYSNWTLAGSIGYGASDGSDVQGVGVNGEARYFVTDNLRLEAGLGYANLDVEGAGETDVWTYGVGGEWQLSNCPLSVLAGWSHLDGDGPDADALTAGVRWNFGAGSLKERDRHGASLAGLSGVSAALGL